MSNAFLPAGVSALSLALAFFYPDCFFWLTFIFMIPIYYAVFCLKIRMSFRYGLAWGVLFWSIHFYALMIMLYEKAHGPWRLTVGTLLIVYFSLHAGLWFWLADKFSRHKHNIFWQAACWVGTSAVYFYWMQYGIFWISGSWQGYCFASPLVACAHYPRLVRGISIFGIQGLTVLLFVTQAIFAIGVIKKSRHYYFFASICLVPFLYGLIIPGHTKRPEYIVHLGYAHPPSIQIKNNFDRAQEINASITRTINKNPFITTVLMPESTCYGSLNKQPEIIDLWQKNALVLKKISLIIGSFRTDNNENLFVTLYNMDAGRIIKHYDKSKLLPVAEYLPCIWKKNNILKDLFLYKQNDFSTKENQPVLFQIAPNCFAQPHICSDLYFNNNFGMNIEKKTPQIIAVNDSWFNHGYMSHLMYLYAVLKSMELKTDIIYVGHKQGKWINGACGATINI